MNKYEYFEFRYSQSNDRCIEEAGKMPETYDNYQMKNMCEYFFDIGFDMRSNKFKELEQQLKESKAEIKDLYSGRLGTCHTCEQVAELNIKLEQQLKEARKHLTESVARECKCESNISVNDDLVSRNLELKKLLDRQYLTKYKVKE